MQATNYYREERPMEEMRDDPPFRMTFALERINEFYGVDRLNHPPNKELDTNKLPIKLLDVGTGRGIFPMICPNAWTTHVTEPDSSLWPGLAELERITVFEKLKDANKSYDVITCMQVLEHVEDPQKLLKQMWEKVKSPGMLIFTVPIHEQLKDADHKWMFNYYDVDELSRNLSNEFQIHLINKFKRKHPTINLFASVITNPEKG